jgi:hypothetical protein
MVFFQLKNEIEDYYEKNYLTREWKVELLVTAVTGGVIRPLYQPNELFRYLHSPYEARILTGIPGKKWYETRFRYCLEYNNRC